MRIHFENDPEAPSALRVTPAMLEAAFGGRPGGADAPRLSFNDDPSRFAESMGDSAIVFAGRKLDLVAAKRANPALRWVQITTAGAEAYLRAVPDGVVLTNASGVHARKGAEFILSAVLMLAFRIPHFVSEREAQRWSPSFGGTLAGRRVTLLGVGAIGAAAVPLLTAHGVKVTGVTRSGRAEAPLDRCVQATDLDAVLPETDILVSTLPLTPQTAGLVDAGRIGLLPRGAGVVVVGRAKVLDYAAMLARLHDGTLDGAVLDVFPTEPIPPADPLWSAPRLVLTPHCSLDDHSLYARACLDIFMENLERFRAGRPLRNIVDPEQGY
jgi:phosphoglycerate dehydrogenase-like enzyme